MRTKLLVFLFFITYSFFGQWSQIGNDIDSSGDYDYLGTSIAINSIGDVIVVGATGDDESESSYNNGVVTVYKKNESEEWVRYGNKIIGEAAYDESGISVSINDAGTIVAIGSIHNDGNGTDAGHVRVYEYNSGTWIQKGTDIDGEAAGDESGTSVSLNNSGTILAIGSPKNDGNGVDAGHVRIYEFASNTWTQVGSDIDGEAAGDESGTSVSLSNSGTILAIGSPKNDGNGVDAGHVRVYEFASNTWTQVGSDIDGVAGDELGASLNLNGLGTILVVGAPLADGEAGVNTGQTKVYNYVSNTWTQLGDSIEGEGSQDESGRAVSINNDGSIIAIGVEKNGPGGVQHGHVRVYEFVSNTWTQVGDDIDGEANDDKSGASVSLNNDGSIVAIGAYKNDASGLNNGHARVYKFTTTTLSSSKYVIKGLSITFNNGGFVSNQNNVTLQVLNSLGQVLINKNLNNDVYIVKAIENTTGNIEVHKIVVY